LFNLFPRISPSDNTDQQFNVGKTITFDQLVEIIKTPNPLVQEARDFGKKSDVYDQIKKTKIPVVFGNGYNPQNERSTKRYFYSTGYIYLDFDFDTVDEAFSYKTRILTTQQQFIAACWLSLSGKGLSVLVKVNPKKCNKYQYLKYWNKLNELFNNELDPRTKDYYRVLCLSYDPDIFVNPSAIEFNTLHPIEYEDGLNYATQIPLAQFENIDKPVVIENGLDVLKVDFFKYRNNKVSAGHRTSTIGAISMQLIYLNPEATKKQLFNALLSFNNHYCEKPLSEKEVNNILKANLKKKVLDVNKYMKKKYIFFHPETKMPKSLKDRIRGEEMKKLQTKAITNCIDILINEVKPNKITIELIAEYVGISKTTVYNYLTPELKSKIERYHQNDTFSICCIYTPPVYNMQQMEKVSSVSNHSKTEIVIYEALEDLQDNVNKITQNRVAEYTGLSLPTIKRNWLPSFKDLAKGYNNGLVKREPLLEEEFPAKRDILSPLPDDQSFEQFVKNLHASRIYKNRDQQKPSIVIR
jgi:hypothetical protein